MKLKSSKFLLNVAVSTILIVFAAGSSFAATKEISVAELRNKIKGGWLVKTAGVSIGEKYEWAAMGTMVTGSINMYPSMAKGYAQDDVYVNVTFLEVMDKKMNGAEGIFAATAVDYGNAFKNTGYNLWHANKESRNRLRQGIQPPASGRHGLHDNDIDWQIESDWIGFMCPGMPEIAQKLSDRAGHVICYGDCVYGGHFVSSMISLAFFESNMRTIVEKAIENIPRDAQYYQIIKDVLDYHKNNPGKSYKDCWGYISPKWIYKIHNCNKRGKDYNIGAAFNGSFIAIGLLYGNHDPLKVIEYSLRCGQDADCNPANAGSVVGAVIGYDKLPQKWRSSIESNANGKYQSSSYTWNTLIETSMKRAEKTILQNGGEKVGDKYVIQIQSPVQPKMIEQHGIDPKPNPHYQKPVSIQRNIAGIVDNLQTSAFRTYAESIIIDHRGRKMNGFNGRLSASSLPRGVYIEYYKGAHGIERRIVFSH